MAACCRLHRTPLNFEDFDFINKTFAKIPKRKHLARQKMKFNFFSLCGSFLPFHPDPQALFLTVLSDFIVTLFMNVIIGAAQEVQKKRAEVEQEIKKQPLNVDTLSKEGFSKVRTGN